MCLRNLEDSRGPLLAIWADSSLQRFCIWNMMITQLARLLYLNSHTLRMELHYPSSWRSTSVLAIAAIPHCRPNRLSFTMICLSAFLHVYPLVRRLILPPIGQSMFPSLLVLISCRRGFILLLSIASSCILLHAMQSSNLRKKTKWFLAI